MLKGPFTTVRVRRDSARRLSDVARLAEVPVCDVPRLLVASLGGPDAAALAVLRYRADAFAERGDAGGDTERTR